MNKKITLGILIVFMAGIMIYLQNQNVEVKLDQINASQPGNRYIYFTLDYGDGSTLAFQQKFVNNENVFGVLQRIAQENKISLEYKKYDAGVFVEKISHRKNGDDGKYWVYYLNGTMPMIAMDKMSLHYGDTIKVSFEKSPF